MRKMSMNESVAYLKGLAEGLDIDTTTKEGKLLMAIIDVLEEMAETVNDIEEVVDENTELIDALDEDLSTLEDDIYGDDEDDDDEAIYEVTCPNCGDTICLDEETLLEGDMECPNCGQKLEFDLDDCDCCCEDDDCDCCNGHE